MVNVSCPNVDWTKSLGAGGKDKKMKSFMDIIEAAAAGGGATKPVLLKIGPDWQDKSELEFYLDLAEKLRKRHGRQVICGFEISNTTASRDEQYLNKFMVAQHGQMPTDNETKTFNEKGGLSGALLKEKANKTCATFYSILKGRKLQKDYLLIGVGGIASAEDALERVKSGATFIQLYSALVYKGPGLVSDIKEGLAELLAKEGYSHVSEAVGVAVA